MRGVRFFKRSSGRLLFMSIGALICVLLPVDAEAAPAPAPIIVAPDGTSTGAGTVADPLDLHTALTSATGPVVPGSDVWLRGGTYVGAFMSNVSGTATDPITVRSYPGEWAILDSAEIVAPTLRVRGSDVSFQSFEVTKSDPNRTSAFTGNRPSDNSRSTWSGVWVTGPRTKLINLVIHDAGDGIGLWRDSVDSEVSGCVIFNNGWLGADHAWGHGIYVQNDVGHKTIVNNMIFNNFGWGVHAFDDLGAIENLTMEGITSFENGAPAWKRWPNVLAGSVRGRTDQITLRDSVLYHRPGIAAENVRLGYEYVDGVTADRGRTTVTNNKIVGGSRPLVLRGWSGADVANNLVVGRDSWSTTPSYVAQVIPRTPGDLASFNWIGNTYRDTADATGSQRAFGIGADPAERRLTFGEWRAETGFDATSAYSRQTPTGKFVSVRRDRYERGRSFVTVLNWSGARTVSIRASSVGLRKGRRYEIRDVQNLNGSPVVKRKYRGGRNIRLPMDLTAIAQPIGGSPAPLVHTPREFGAFVVRVVR